MGITSSGGLPISVLIPTKNEEGNIRDCIESVLWANEVFVLDSHSSDGTVCLARRMGAQVFQRAFDDYSSNKKWALENIPFKNDFVFILDADMRVTEALRNELTKEFQGGPGADAYYVPIRNLFFGRWIKHGGWYPNFHLMLFRRGRAVFEDRLVHAHVLAHGNISYLRNDVLHVDRKGIAHFIERHNTYSDMEAVEVFPGLASRGGGYRLQPSLKRVGPERRRLLKMISYQYLPARSLLKFLWMYLLRLGFLDGRIGFRYCVLHAFYEYLISLKLEELRDPESAIHRAYSQYLRGQAWHSCSVGTRKPGVSI